MGIGYPLFSLLLLGGLLYRWWRSVEGAFLKVVFWPALLFKVGSGLAVGGLYQYYLKGGDTFGYQQQADLLSQYAHQHFSNYLHFMVTGEYESVYLYTIMKYRGYSNSFFMVWLLHLLNFITGSHYYLNSLYFSVFSFAGAWRLTQVLSRIFPTTAVPAAVAFLFFPSLVFWSSGVLKESVLLGSFCLLLAAVLQLVYRPREHPGREMLWLGLAAYGCFKIRFYFAAAYFPLLFSFALTEIAARRRPTLLAKPNRLFFYLSALAVLGGGAFFLHEAINIDNFFHQLLNSYHGLRTASAGGVLIDYPDLQPTFRSVLYYAPKAVASAIFRPFVGEINALPYLLAGLENLLVLLLTVVAFVSYRSFRSPLPITLIISLLLYIAITAALIGLSTPNLGTLSRYKVAFMPFLLYLLLQTGLVGRYLNQAGRWLDDRYRPVAG